MAKRDEAKIVILHADEPFLGMLIAFEDFVDKVRKDRSEDAAKTIKDRLRSLLRK